MYIYAYCIVLRRKGPVLHGWSAKTVLYAIMYVHIVLRRKGPVLHERSAKTVLYIHLSGGRDPYGTGGVRRRCFISYWEEGTCMAQAECEDGAMIYI